MYKILVINPGSTSTKIALYKNETQIFQENINHNPKKIAKYKNIVDQLDMRKEEIQKVLTQKNINMNEIDAVVGRGGMLPPVKSGAYLVNEEMINRLKNKPISEHASNLGAIIAYEIAKQINVSSYIYDSVAVDEMNVVARLSGNKEINRKALSHVLNSRAMAIKYAKSISMKYEDLNLIVAHLGGGISLSIHEKGVMVDLVSDDEGPFAPERSGRIPALSLIELCYSGKYDKSQMKKFIRGNGGIVSYLDTVDVREVEKMIKDGDEYAHLVYDAMVYQIAKGIGELATVTSGKIDAIILTGGVAYSDKITEKIKKKVEFIAPVCVLAGENEMESLAFGILRVLNGEEKAREYVDMDLVRNS